MEKKECQPVVCAADDLATPLPATNGRQGNGFRVEGMIVDVVGKRIFPGRISVEQGRIAAVEEDETLQGKRLNYIMPGLVDAHVHIESSMLVPAEFARVAVTHGTVATVSDPHEIANVMGVPGIRFMVDNGKSVPFKFFFGVPSCVPATTFETSGAVIDADQVARLLEDGDMYYLAEMMNYPGVVNRDKEVLAKMDAARRLGLPIDGHAPALGGDDLKAYVEAGISTDHECFSLKNAREKIALGNKVIIREGSAGRNFNALIPLMAESPDMLMFCSDDKSASNLLVGHINSMVRHAITLGYNPMDVIRAATLHAVRHYNLPVGLLQEGDAADFIVVDNLADFRVLQTYIDGVKVAENGQSLLKQPIMEEPVNTFIDKRFTANDFEVTLPAGAERMRVIEVTDGHLVTGVGFVSPKTDAQGRVVTDTAGDVLKVVVVNRYHEAPPVVAFIRNVGLKRGAMASSVAHDSHNIIAVGVTDEAIARAVNSVVEARGGISVCLSDDGSDDAELNPTLALPVGGLMSMQKAEAVAAQCKSLNAWAHELGSALHAPFMTMSFLALLVIPSLRISDKGLFDADHFRFVSLFD